MVTTLCNKKTNAILNANPKLLNDFKAAKAAFEGVKLSELGEKNNIFSYSELNNKFAEKLMLELNKKGIVYSAKVGDETTILVKRSDKALVDQINKGIMSELKALKNKSNPTQNKLPKHVKR